MPRVIRGRRTKSTTTKAKPIRHSHSRDVDTWFSRIAQGKSIKRVESRLTKYKAKH